MVAINYQNIVYDLCHELPNELRLTILGNQEIFGKCQYWLEIELSARNKTCFQKKHYCSSGRKLRRSSYQRLRPKSVYWKAFNLVGGGFVLDRTTF